MQRLRYVSDEVIFQGFTACTKHAVDPVGKHNKVLVTSSSGLVLYKTCDKLSRHKVQKTRQDCSI